MSLTEQRGGRRRPRGRERATSRAGSPRRASSSCGPKARRSRPPTAALPGLRRRDRVPEHRATASLPSWPRSTSRSTGSCTSASWSGATSPTSRCAGGSRSTRPARASEQKSILVNSGGRGGRERRQDRARGLRSSGRRRLRERLPRTHAPDHGDDEQGAARTRRASARSRGEVYRAQAPYPYRGIDTERGGRRSRASVQERGRRRVRGVRRARDRAGRGRLHPDARRLPGARFAELCARHGILYVADEVQSGVGRTGPMWAVEHHAASSRIWSSPASRSAAACRWRPSPAAPRSWTRPARRPRRHVRRPPGLLRGGGACSTRSRSREFRARADDLGRRFGPGSTRWPARHAEVGEVRGLGPMLARSSREQSAGAGAACDRGGVRARAAPAGVWALWQRAPAAATAHGDRRGARPGAWMLLEESLARRRLTGRDVRCRTGLAQAVRRRDRAGRGRPGGRGGEFFTPARARPVGEDDHAAADRRLRAAGRGRSSWPART